MSNIDYYCIIIYQRGYLEKKIIITALLKQQPHGIMRNISNLRAMIPINDSVR